MTRLLSTQNRRVVVVTPRANAIPPFELRPSNCIGYSVGKDYILTEILPPGSWQQPFRACDCTELQAKEIVEGELVNKWDSFYKDYKTGEFNNYFPLKSFLSWCTVNGVQPTDLIVLENK